MNGESMDNLGSQSLPSPMLPGGFSVDPEAWGRFWGSANGIGTGINWTSILLFFQLIFVLVIVGSLIVWVYYYLAQQALRNQRQEWLEQYVAGGTRGKDERPKTRWDHVQTLFRSKNEAEWRVGIIEADAMLDDLMIRLGYRGNSLGERLRSANRQDFPTLEAAWSAHDIRNKIAHEGSGFSLSQTQALRVMRWYEQVFRQSGYIR